MPHQTKLNFYMPEPMLSNLRRSSAENGISVSAYIRQAISHEIWTQSKKRYPWTQPEPDDPDLLWKQSIEDLELNFLDDADKHAAKVPVHGPMDKRQ